jgi:hypothetical protein
MDTNLGPSNRACFILSQLLVKSDLTPLSVACSERVIKDVIAREIG